ncbi:SDR family oxidoreductase [Aeromicrobium fastidiosum]|uniref:SDR family oxidoreductase n=1 Tax=Aeromicrobium fastidiosum TaxID=52699 RepID=A0A641AST2_9ACTN|nr:SDR family oxidoreductase [Aeromicrobium fastidiosum]KAA1379948.1 SDR family oxidoreductase [Aeromicrobium fastidiosum]MBP2389458.1 NAD(P)-dependent dehydrogenase (short-subunit alcohol dehydrogenase family) [Aeromicrobium fastidiosum]
MQIENAVVLVTGANRGIGAAFVAELKSRGAAKIYAASRAGDVDVEGVEPLRLDVTDPAQIEAAAAAAGDVQIVINNAGVSTGTSVVSGDLATIKQEMDTNFYGPLLMTRAFAPILRANGGGAVINIVSALSWFTMPGAGAYAASKAAAWSLTDSTRLELAGQGTHVVGVHMGLVDTDMTAGFDAPKVSPSAVAGAALDAVESGLDEVLADDWAKLVKSGLVQGPSERHAQLFAALSAS